MYSFRSGFPWITSLAFVITMACASANAYAQERAEPIRQTELWGSVGVKGRLPGFMKDALGKALYKKFKVAGEIGYRSADTFFAGRQVYVDLGLSYKINSHFDLTAEHRIGFRLNDSNRNRTGVQLNFDTKWNRFNFQYRLNYQHNYLEFGNEREIIRNKFALEYNIKKFKLDPEISTEFFTWIGYQGVQYIGTRHSLGTSYSPNKTHKIGLKLVHDREYGVAWPTYRWIYSISYTLNLREL